MRRVGTLSAMPGQAGDSPGVVRLEDRHGTLIHEADIEMVQLVRKIEWSPDGFDPERGRLEAA
jgi:hypothetical protein